MESRIFNRGLVNLAACISVAFFGITMYFWGVMLPVVGAKIEGIASLPWLLTLGIVCGTIVCGTVMDRYGYKWLLILSCLAIATGLLIFAYANTLYLFIISALLIGGGGGVINSEAIAIVSDIYDDDRRGVMLGILGGTYCLGSLIWTFLCRIWIESPLIPILGSAVIIILFSLLFIFINFPHAKIDKSERVSFSDVLNLLKNEVIIVVSLVLFFQGMVEAVSANYSTSYLANIEGGIGAKLAVTTLIYMTVGMTIGRYSLILSLKYLGNIASLVLFMLVAFAGALLQRFYPASYTASALSMLFLGFGVGATSPIAFTYLGQIFRKYSGMAVSVVVLVAQVGMLIGNFFIGRLFAPGRMESGSFRSFPLLLSLGIVIVIILFPLIQKSVVRVKVKNLDL